MICNLELLCTQWSSLLWFVQVPGSVLIKLLEEMLVDISHWIRGNISLALELLGKNLKLSWNWFLLQWDEYLFHWIVILWMFYDRGHMDVGKGDWCFRENKWMCSEVKLPACGMGRWFEVRVHMQGVCTIMGIRSDWQAGASTEPTLWARRSSVQPGLRQSQGERRTCFVRTQLAGEVVYEAFLFCSELPGHLEF